MESVEGDENSNTEKQCAQRIRRRRPSRWDNVDSDLHRLVPSEPANNIAGNRINPSSNTSAAHNEQNGNVPSVPVGGIKWDQITEIMIPKAIDLIFRTPRRISQEIQIVADLELFLKEHKFNLQVMPFGSATNGFGGASTDFNICLFNKEGS